MADFQPFTRGDSSPQGKPRVYFTAHEDGYRFFDDIKDELLGCQNCAVFRLDADVKPEDVDDYELRLGQMQLFVVPVTTRLLTTPNRAMDVEIPFAFSHHIPVLPLMQESGLDELFNEKFGDLQYLYKYDTDPTAIPYDEKLTKYLNAVIVGDELAEKVRAAFDAYIFLSYRKKDRQYAQELMKLIHKNPLCRDIAIWYDEFLTPGEDFNKAIETALEKSDLFALAVTPNLVNEVNYILTTEYPAAKKLNKDIFPAEMLPTDRAKLAEMYEDIPEVVNSGDDDAMRERLLSLIQKLAITANESDPQHNFFIGLAYLSGIDVEVDHKRAEELITGSAEAGCTEAIEKLISMYENGEGVKHNYSMALQWRKKHVELLKERYEKDQAKENAVILAEATRDCAYALYLQEKLSESEEMYEQLMVLAVSYIKQHYLYPFSHYFVDAFEGVGIIRETKGDYKKAETYYLKCIDYNEMMIDDPEAIDVRRLLSGNYLHLADVEMKMHEKDKADEYYQKCLKIREALTEEKNTIQARRDLAEIYQRIGSRYSEYGRFKKAEHYFLRYHELSRSLAEEDLTTKAQYCYADSYECLGMVAVKMNDYSDARKHYLKALEIREDILRKEGVLNVGLALNYGFLGQNSLFEGDLTEARTYCQKAYSLFKRLVHNFKGVRRDLALTSQDLGLLEEKAGDPEKAEAYFREALKIFEQLFRENNTHLSREDMARAYYNIGHVTKDVVMLNKAYDIAFELASSEMGHTRYRQLITAIIGEQMKAKGGLGAMIMKHKEKRAEKKNKKNKH